MENFSKHSIIKLAKKAGIKSISTDAIDLIKEILNQKIIELAEDVTTFYTSKNCKTIEVNTILKMLECNNIYYCT